ncbi:hypothetical protein DBV05_g8406 [Lasiodiplodia theobromae]|uniref:Uncharacterized protein n=1 Tax=Lasiodiplodia theobromae TaxID=45133 RepID=A0A5N5D685_9PEZI|nr:hypothetical protein DBV05_g8406 [Lasiodiplodia theobromae]
MSQSRRSSTSSSDDSNHVILPRRHIVLLRRAPHNDPFASSDEDELARRIGRRTQRRLEREARREEARTWVPPRPEREYEQWENVERLRGFQQMPLEQQRRVFRLNLHESYTTAQAIDTVRTEAKYNLLEAPLAARVEQTATIRFLYDEAASKIFGQWIVLEFFVRDAPDDQKDAAERIFRLVSLDPYDRQFMMSACRLAGEIMNNKFLDKLLDEMKKQAFIFKGHDADLRALRQYDRPPVDPPRVAFANDVLDRLRELLKLEPHIQRAITQVGQCLWLYKAHMMTWLVKLLELNSSDPAVKSISDMHPGLETSGTYNVVDCFSDIMHMFGEKKVKNFDADEPLTIMCLGFYHCCLGISGRATYEQIERVMNRQEWPEETTNFLARAVSDGVSDVYYNKSSKYESRVGKYLVQDLEEHRDSNPEDVEEHRDSNLAIADFLHTLDGDGGAAAELALSGDWSFLPADVQARMFSCGMATKAGEALGGLHDALKELSTHLDTAKLLIPSRLLPSQMPRISGRVIKQMNDVADMIKASVYEKPRQEMLKQLARATLPSDVERVRDLAFAGNAEPSIKESIELLMDSSILLDDIHYFVADMERAHLSRIAAASDESRLIAALSIFLDETDWSAIRSTLLKMTDAATTAAAFSRWDFGRALRYILDHLPADMTDGDAIKALCTAALRDPTTNVLRLLQAPAPSGDGEYSQSDTRAIARLVLRAWYLSQEAAPSTAPDMLRWLSRHCWQFGLLAAWQDARNNTARLRTVTTDLLARPDVTDFRVLPNDLFGLAPLKGEINIPAAVGYVDIHRLVRFDGCVVDGGRIVVAGGDDDQMDTA